MTVFVEQFYILVASCIITIFETVHLLYVPKSVSFQFIVQDDHRINFVGPQTQQVKIQFTVRVFFIRVHHTRNNFS